MRRSMSWLLAGVMMLVLTGVASPAFAQDSPKADVSVGYQWAAFKATGDNAGDDEEWEKFPKGWYADAAFNVTPMFSVVGQVSGNYKHFDDDDFDLKAHTFMAGFRASSAGRTKGYGQILFGGVNVKASDDTDSASETDFAIQLGAGVNVAGNSRVGLRLGIDWLRVMGSDDGEVLGGADLNGFRFIVGVNFAVGG